MQPADRRSPWQLIRERNTARVQVAVGIATFVVAGLLAITLFTRQTEPTDWTGAVSPIVLVVIGGWMLLRGVRGLS